MPNPPYSAPSDYLLDILGYAAGIRMLIKAGGPDMEEAVELELQRIERCAASIIHAIAGTPCSRG